ncbi:response regulator [Candidatus Bipolaricaulota bacterium]
MGNSETQELGGLNILWAEDNPNDVQQLRKALRDLGYKGRLEFARDPVDALALLRGQGEYEAAFQPDLIISDINMPKMHGLEFIKLLKKDDEFRSIPFVFFNISEREEDIWRAYDAGAAGYFITPISAQDFQPLIKRILDYWSVSMRPVGSKAD